MSSVRYTAGSSYDRARSVDITPPSATPLDVLGRDEDGDQFYANDRRGDYYALPAHYATDGIYANFEDGAHACYMVGGDQGDVLVGSEHADALDGGSGDDLLKGGSGNDTIYGGAGADRVIGGAGMDVFGFLPGQFATGSHLDVIGDFSGSRTDGDRIEVDQLGTPVFIGAHSFHADGSFEVKAVADRHGYIVKGDTNGDGTTDFAFQVDTTTPLTQRDFQSNADIEPTVALDHPFGGLSESNLHSADCPMIA